MTRPVYMQPRPAPRPFYWTPERLSVLRGMWSDGRPSPAIGKVFGVSHGAVLKAAKRYGLPARGQPVAEIDRKMNECFDLIADGLSVRDAALRAGVSPSTARDHFRRFTASLGGQGA